MTSWQEDYEKGAESNRTVKGNTGGIVEEKETSDKAASERNWRSEDLVRYDNFLRFQEILSRSGPVYSSKRLVKRNPIVDLIRMERAGYLLAMPPLGLENDDAPKRGPGRPLVVFRFCETADALAVAA